MSLVAQCESQQILIRPIISAIVEAFMSKHNIAAKPKEEQDKVNVDQAASGVPYKDSLNMPLVSIKHNNWYHL